MKITKLHSLTFQRNGVRGQSFYCASFNWIDSPERGKNFIATFCTVIEKDDDAGNVIDVESCRVVDPNNVTEKWRGDEFAYALQDFLNAKLESISFGSFYDLTTNEKENKMYQFQNS